jgi:hypothetical protein
MARFPLMKAAETGSSVENDYKKNKLRNLHRGKFKSPRNLFKTGNFQSRLVPVQAGTSRNSKNFLLLALQLQPTR